MKGESASARRKELAAFLQIIRNRSQPADFGFPAGSRRRTAGLRREEMAQIVGISTTWYTWIEQGREVNISAEALDRVAGNLRLTRSERAYLFEIADRRDPQVGLRAARSVAQPRRAVVAGAGVDLVDSDHRFLCRPDHPANKSRDDARR